MGSFANTLFTIMLGWIQAAASAIWSAFTTENGGSFLQWIGRNWFILAVILCVIGMVIDFGIYLLRWRPVRVWKSFFRRLQHGKEEAEEPEQTVETPAPAGGHFRNEEEPARQSDSLPLTAEAEPEDFSRWAQEEPEPIPVPETMLKRPIITGAGYTVPEDSPYRRPAAEMPTEPIIEERRTDEPENRPEIMTQRKRKRRLIVGDLFTDPEEELYQYERPQQLIDKDKAYCQPVYPRNWKKDEGELE